MRKRWKPSMPFGPDKGRPLSPDPPMEELLPSPPDPIEDHEDQECSADIAISLVICRRIAFKGRKIKPLMYDPQGKAYNASSINSILASTAACHLN
jgi:hypothetical protein